MITELAQKIFDAQPNDYWVPKDNPEYRYHLTTAVDFGEDACRLAGPFLEKYGLVYVEEYLNPKRLNVIQTEWIEDAKRSVMNLPYPLAQKVRDFHKYSDQVGMRYFFKDGQMISEIDVKAGYHRQQDWNEKRCSLFATTPKGVELLFSPLNQYERDQHNRRAYEIAESWLNEEKDCMPCAERPFLVRVQGTDDTSWSRNFATLEDAYQLVKDLEAYGFSVINEQMHFTN